VRFAPILIALATAVAFVACGSDNKGDGGTVKVGLQEWSINLDKTSLPNGDITFDLDNKGPNFAHQFVVLKTDLAPDKLPTKSDGSVDTGGAGVNKEAEIQKIETDDTGSGTFTLTAGKYVFICNLVTDDKGEHHVHYGEGMRTAFTVQ
jgi:hypothetical protein